MAPAGVASARASSKAPTSPITGRFEDVVCSRLSFVQPTRCCAYSWLDRGSMSCQPQSRAAAVARKSTTARLNNPDICHVVPRHSQFFQTQVSTK